MAFFSRQTLPSIRSKTATLVLACALPTVVGFAALSYDSYQREHENLLRDAERVAQQVLLLLERDLDAAETATRALASSPSLDQADLAAFHQQARSILGPGYPGAGFVLSDLSGAALLSTRVAYGQTPPANANQASVRKVAADATVRTSTLYRPGPGQALMASVDVPVRRDGKVMYVLSAQLTAEHLNLLLAAQRLPPGWTAQVFDADHHFVARNINAEKVTGMQARPELIAALQRGASGVVELTSREGVAVYSTFQRSVRRGWYVSVAVPRAAAYEALQVTFNNVFLSVAALLIVGFATAWAIGGAIGRSVRALCAPAAALGRGEALALPALRIREAAEVGAALQQLENELTGYRTELETRVAARTVELERAKVLLETVYATAPVGLAMLDPDLRIVMVNDYLAALNAIPVADHLGHTLPELLGELGVHYEEAYRTVRDTGLPLKAVEASGPVPADPGVERHWIVSYHPVFGHDHTLVGISSVVLDVSERKVLSDRLRDVNEQFRGLYELSGDAHMLLAESTGFISGNLAAARIFGCTSIEDLLAMSMAAVSPEFQPDGRRSADKAAQFIRYALEMGSHHFEWLHRRRDGSLFHADVLLTSLNLGGKGILQATVRDISERVAADRALRATSSRLEQSERFIRTVTDNVPGMVGYWDATLHCQFANRLYLEWFARSAEQMIGKPMHEVLGAETMAADAPYLRAVLAGNASHFAREVRGANGEIRHTWSNYIPDFDERGEVRGFYVLVSDVTELKRTELRLQSLNEELSGALLRAETASSAKSEFLANMSHEIRTPMNAIMGLARLLQEAPLERRERGYVAKITMSTRSLMGILNDVLDFSKIEAGQLTLEYTAFSLCQLLDSVSVLMAANAHAKGVELVFAVAPQVPLQLLGDPMRLEQVLLNLIGNAIKFTDQGEVVLNISCRGCPDAADTGARAGVILDFSVRDSGIGIAPEQQAHMFDAFSQGDTSTSRKYGGTGLGLAICRRLVSLMGGEIGVRSQLGAGSDFHFDSGFGVPPANAQLALPPLRGLAERRVLVVDDNLSVRSALLAWCQGLGWQAGAAASGADALEQLRAATRAGQPYDFMFLDTAMTEIDGIATLTYARAEPQITMPRTALMVAASARDQLDLLASDLKLDAILSKPVTPESFLATIVELHTGKAVPDLLSAPTPLAGRLQGLRILLVEDNPINQEVANYILLHAGAAVDIAANGQIAVTMLIEAPKRYDVVLMDIQMPVLNGYQATEAIRAMGMKDLPVVAMTANAMEADRAMAIRVGMNGHVAKPIDVDNLVAALNKVTSGGDARELRAAPRSGYGQAAAFPEGLPAVPIAGIDLRSTLPRFGGNFANFVTLFKRFESSQGGTLDEVRTLLQGADRSSAIQLVHRLRGVAANLGASELAALALEFEHALRGAGEAELMLRLTALDAALQAVFESARNLVQPNAAQAASPHPGGADGAQLGVALAELLSLLQNNNLKAMAAFDALRPALETALAPDILAQLAESIATLAFAPAAAQLQDIMNRKGSA